MTTAEDTSDVAECVTELQDVLLGTESIEKFVHELAVQAARLVAGSLSCGITLTRAGRTATVACSDELAGHVNNVQYDLMEGPCLAALEDGCPVRIDDMATETRWARFCRQAAASGIGSCLALPLVAQEETIGALNLYSRASQAFGAQETGRAEGFAQNAAGALALGMRLVSYAELTDQLRASLASRAAIDQAVGVVMAQQRCTQHEAFAVLRAASNNRNVKLREVARDIVASVSGEQPQAPPFERG